MDQREREVGFGSRYWELWEPLRAPRVELFPDVSLTAVVLK